MCNASDAKAPPANGVDLKTSKLAVAFFAVAFFGTRSSGMALRSLAIVALATLMPFWFAGPATLHNEDLLIPTTLTKTLSPQEIDEYRRDGVIKVEGLVAPFEQEMNALLDINDHRPPFACVYQSFMFHLIMHRIANATNFGRQVDLMCSDASAMFQEVDNIIFNSAIGSIAAQLLGTSHVRLDQTVVMRTDGSSATPWHHDAGAFLTNGTGIVVWIPFEPSSPETDGLKFIAGSHEFPASSNSPSFCNAGDQLATCLEQIGKRHEEDPTKNVLSYNLKVGDAILFDRSTMHASTGLNMKPRHSLQIRLFGAGDDVERAYFKNIRGATYGVPYGLHDDRANTFRFPQIYPNILPNEFAQRIAYKTSSGFVNKVKYLFDMARVSINSFGRDVTMLCPEGKCFRL